MYSIFESEIAVQADLGNHHGDEYAKYFKLVALVRQDQLARFYDLSIDKIESRGYKLIISTAHINFISELQDGDSILIKTQIDNFSGGAYNVNFWIHKKENKKLIADGYFVYTLKSSLLDLPDQFPDDFINKLSI
jgi:acyl-CoA thioesterase FadM